MLLWAPLDSVLWHPDRRTPAGQGMASAGIVPRVALTVLLAYPAIGTRDRPGIFRHRTAESRYDRTRSHIRSIIQCRAQDSRRRVLRMLPGAILLSASALSGSPAQAQKESELSPLGKLIRGVVSPTPTVERKPPPPPPRDVKPPPAPVRKLPPPPPSNRPPRFKSSTPANQGTAQPKPPKPSMPVQAPEPAPGPKAATVPPSPRTSLESQSTPPDRDKAILDVEDAPSLYSMPTPMPTPMPTARPTEESVRQRLLREREELRRTVRSKYDSAPSPIPRAEPSINPFSALGILALGGVAATAAGRLRLNVNNTVVNTFANDFAKELAVKREVELKKAELYELIGSRKPNAKKILSVASALQEMRSLEKSIQTSDGNWEVRFSTENDIGRNAKRVVQRIDTQGKMLEVMYEVGPKSTVIVTSPLEITSPKSFKFKYTDFKLKSGSSTYTLPVRPFPLRGGGDAEIIYIDKSYRVDRVFPGDEVIVYERSSPETQFISDKPVPPQPIKKDKPAPDQPKKKKINSKTGQNAPTASTLRFTTEASNSSSTRPSRNSDRSPPKVPKSKATVSKSKENKSAKPKRRVPIRRR